MRPPINRIRPDFPLFSKAQKKPPNELTGRGEGFPFLQLFHPIGGNKKFSSPPPWFSLTRFVARSLFFSPLPSPHTQPVSPPNTSASSPPKKRREEFKFALNPPHREKKCMEAFFQMLCHASSFFPSFLAKRCVRSGTIGGIDICCPTQKEKKEEFSSPSLSVPHKKKSICPIDVLMPSERRRRPPSPPPSPVRPEE